VESILVRQWNCEGGAMGENLKGYGQRGRFSGLGLRCLAVQLLLIAWAVSSAGAFQFDTGSPDWMVRWDNTVKFSSDFRVDDQNGRLLSNINADDGDRNFTKGVVSARWDLLSEFEVRHLNYGLFVSATSWLDPVYLTGNANNSPATFNGLGSYDQFNDGAKDNCGANMQILDAYIYDHGSLGTMPLSFRFGRCSIVWGESLFFPDNSITWGMMPIDLYKALMTPAAQAQELYMPIGQFWEQLQLCDNFTLEGFGDFEWQRCRIPPVGSYVSNSDVVGPGAQRILLGPNPPGGLGPAFWRGPDMGGGNDTGQVGQAELGAFGMAARYSKWGVDWGLYYHRYNETLPQVYIRPGVIQTPGGPVVIDPSIINLARGKIGEYYEVFPKDINMVGASFGTVLGAVNVSGEASARLHTPLVSTPQIVLPGESADNDDHPLYAVGNTFHADLSATYSLQPGPIVGGFRLWQGGAILAEAGYQYLINVTDNDSALDPTCNHYAMGFRVQFAPAYYQVCPNLDLSVPITVGYNPVGKSPVDPIFNVTDADRGGDFSVGLVATYKQVWHGGISYTNYFGSVSTNPFVDRDFLSFYVQRTF
jgi:hypothetical protein